MNEQVKIPAWADGRGGDAGHSPRYGQWCPTGSPSSPISEPSDIRGHLKHGALWDAFKPAALAEGVKAGWPSTSGLPGASLGHGPNSK